MSTIVQERRYSSALAMELCFSCTNPPIWDGYTNGQTDRLTHKRMGIQTLLMDGERLIYIYIWYETMSWDGFLATLLTTLPNHGKMDCLTWLGWYTNMLFHSFKIFIFLKTNWIFPYKLLQVISTKPPLIPCHPKPAAKPIRLPQ